MSVELMPCPWCGGDGEISRATTTRTISPGLYLSIYIPMCKTCGLSLRSFRSYDKAVTTWNHRTPAQAPSDPRLEVAVEALEKAWQDINWMLNEEKFLNPHVFNYLDDALAKIKGC